MSIRIAKALAALFEKHRIVFWYDAKKELRAEFDAVTILGVAKMQIVNNDIKTMPEWTLFKEKNPKM